MLRTFLNRANNVDMSSESEERRPAPVRVHVTLTGDLAAAYAEVREITDLGDPELGRQAFIRLFNEVRERGELVTGKLIPRSA